MRSPEQPDNPFEESPPPEPRQAITPSRDEPEVPLAEMSLGSLLYYVLAGSLWSTVES